MQSADKTRTRSSPFLLLCTICFVSTWNKCPWESKRHRTRRWPYPHRGAGGGLFSLSNTCRPWLNLIRDDKQLHTTSKRRERPRPWLASCASPRVSLLLRDASWRGGKRDYVKTRVHSLLATPSPSVGPTMRDPTFKYKSNESHRGTAHEYSGSFA